MVLLQFKWFLELFRLQCSNNIYGVECSYAQVFHLQGILNVALIVVSIEPKVYGLKKVHATRIPTKTEYSFKGL